MISIELTTYHGICQKVDSITSLSPCGHDGSVDLRVPYEGYHAVETIVGVLLDVGQVGGCCGYEVRN